MSDKHPFHIAKALEFGWDVLSRRWVALVVWTVVLAVPHLMIFGANVIFAIVTKDQHAPLIMKLVSVVVHIVTYLLHIRVTLLCMDDEPAAIGDVFSAFKCIIPFAIAGFLFYVGVTVGLMALVVPGIYVGLSMGLYSFIIVDQQLGPIAALKRSLKITRGHLLQLLLFYFVLCMVVFGGMICFMIGVIPASIVSTLALGRVYRQLDRAYDGVNEDDEEEPAASDAESEAAG